MASFRTPAVKPARIASTNMLASSSASDPMRCAPKIRLVPGAREVAGRRGRPGTGFFVTGTDEFLLAGEDFDRIRAKFGWARPALKITVESATQTL